MLTYMSTLYLLYWHIQKIRLLIVKSLSHWDKRKCCCMVLNLLFQQKKEQPPPKKETKPAVVKKDGPKPVSFHVLSKFRVKLTGRIFMKALHPAIKPNSFIVFWVKLLLEVQKKNNPCLCESWIGLVKNSLNKWSDINSKRFSYRNALKIINLCRYF